VSTPDFSRRHQKSVVKKQNIERIITERTLPSTRLGTLWRRGFKV
jgi:hypothetical protein